MWSSVIGAISFMAIIKFLRLLRFNKHISHFASTLRMAKSDLLDFMVVFFILMTAFACVAYFAFGRDNYSLSDMIKTYESLYAMLVGRFKLGEFNVADR